MSVCASRARGERRRNHPTKRVSCARNRNSRTIATECRSRKSAHTRAIPGSPDCCSSMFARPIAAGKRLRGGRIVIRQFVIACLVAAGAFAGCTQVVRHPAPPTPSTGLAPEPARPASLAAVARVPLKPLHKGYADLSTGLYIREDDDLVVNTAMPIILRRTYNSGDGGHSRQFG